MARVLIADASAEIRDLMRDAIGSVAPIEVVGETSSAGQVRQLVNSLKIDVLVMDRDMGGVGTFNFITQLRDEHRAMGIIITANTPDVADYHKALKAGADDLVAKPFEADGLRQSVLEVAHRQQLRQVAMEAGEGGRAGIPSKIVAVYSPQGGVGKSLLAVNMAVALAMESGYPTCLVDLNLQFGDTDLMLNITPEHSIASVVQRTNQLDADLLESFLTLHEQSGLKVLSAPTNPEQGQTITVSVVEQVLRVLRERYTYIVIDTPSQMQEVTFAAMGSADEILLLTALDLLALRNTRTALDTMERQHYGRDKVKLVLNRSNAEMGIKREEVPEVLAYEVSAYIPSEGKVAVMSINDGEPFVITSPRSKIGLAVRRIAYKVMGREDEFHDTDQEAAAPEEKKRKGLFGLW